jgi:tetratricopeptide (TPR) repeat protein
VFFGVGPIVFPPTIVVGVPMAIPAPIVRPAAAQLAAVEMPVPAGVMGLRGVDPLDPAAEIRRRVDVLKPSTPAGRGRADRLISSGDTAFADQVYARSTARYREAIARAPDYSEPHFRLAHAYVATRQYNLALTSALMALELAGGSRRDGFSLAELYRGNKFSRRKHDDQLRDAALREPDDGGLQFLIGMTLHYGGNPLQAREHFREAARLAGPQKAYARHFLPVVEVGEPDPEGAGREVK